MEQKSDDTEVVKQLENLSLSSSVNDEKEYENLVKKTLIQISHLQIPEDAPEQQKERLEKFEKFLDKMQFIEIRKYLNAVLTTLEFNLPENLNQSMDNIIQYEFKQNSTKIVDSNTIPRLYEGCKVAIWRGDITTLKVDAIVNAANKYMLGCFTPNHPCIDNQIHCKAGPRLREECRVFMDKQAHLEETGKAKITKAYNLPSKHVLHTVGPIAKEVGERSDLLQSCYEECMSLAKEHKCRSIAFCCISTGVFGYRQFPAAKVALETVKKLLEGTFKDDFDLVVFNVWTEKDLEIYNHLTPTYFKKEENKTE